MEIDADVSYPDWLDRWWQSQAVRYFGTDSFASCQVRLERHIQELSDLFTTGRTNAFGAYADKEALLLAYGLFYFPQTFVRVRFPLREAVDFRGWTAPGDRALRILDIGAGLGGALLGAVTALQGARPRIEATAVDRSAASLARLRMLFEENRARLTDVELQTVTGDLRSFPKRQAPGPGYDLIMASFSLGEAFFGDNLETVFQWTQSTVDLLAPGGLLLLLEPALRETSERIEGLRDRIAEEEDAWILAPCPHDRRCPLLADGKYWCHEVRKWNPPAGLSFLNRHLFRTIQDLKFSFLALSNAPAPHRLPDAPPAQTGRLVTPMSEMKGKFLFGACTADGERHEFELQKRDLSKADRTRLAAYERGDSIAARAPGMAGKSAVFRLDQAGQLKGLWSPKKIPY